MYRILPENLIRFAELCPAPLYVVGGSVRDFLCGYLHGKASGADWDICSPSEEDLIISCAEQCGFSVCAVYKQTGTVKLRDNAGENYEFTRFRSDKYVRGIHTPVEITFTDKIEQDAVRRDFCANAVYYDIKARTFVDPLGGIADIKERTLRTVAPAQKVFGEDGLRLMRLARIAAQIGFTPDENCLEGARFHARLILDIAPERIFSELTQLLHADEKHGFADAPYRGLRLLRESGVLNFILPELALGDGMAQRADFHKYDVLEHSFRCVRYAPASVRLAALLHDVGKPFCFCRDGNFHAHAEEGARIAQDVLARLKAPKKLALDVGTLILLHMKDYDLKMRERKIKKIILQNEKLFPKLLALKQADYTACKDDPSPAPCVVKWETLYRNMKLAHIPLSLGELTVGGRDLLETGIAPQNVGTLLDTLLRECALDGLKNEKAVLIRRAEKLNEKKETP